MILLLWCLASVPLLQETPAPAANPALEKFLKEEADDLAKAAKDLAEKHYKLAKWCERNKMNRRARYHYLRAISYNADHDGSRKALGYKKSGAAWAEPKEAALHVAEDEKIAPPEKPEDITAEWKSFQTQYHAILNFRSERDLKLADKAKKAGLPEEEKRILRRITQYWPDHVDARKRLQDVRVERAGYTDSQGRAFRPLPIWVESFFDKLYDALRVKGPLKEKDEEEARIPLSLLSFATERFRLSCVFPEDRAKAYLHGVEAGFQFVEAICADIPMPKRDFPIRIYLFVSRDDFQKALESIVRVGPKQLLQYIGAGQYRDSLRWFFLQEDSDLNYVDTFFHKGAEIAMESFFPNLPPWFQEGLAYSATLELNGSCHTTCLSVDKGTQVEVTDQWRQPNAWRDLLVESVLLDEDPSSKELLTATFNRLKSRGGVKAWSIVQFLRESDRQAFHNVLKDIAGKQDPFASIETHFQLDARLLDEKWREWVLGTY